MKRLMALGYILSFPVQALMFFFGAGAVALAFYLPNFVVSLKQAWAELCGEETEE